MAVQYKNRTGKIFYLREGKTKTGKPYYFFSSKQDGKGKAVEHIPEGYEIYEHPVNAQIFLRKKRPQLITEGEKQLVTEYAENLKRSRRYRVDCKDVYITIYESDTDAANLKNLFNDVMKYAPLRPGKSADDAMRDLLRITDQHYTAVMRFCLADMARRKFTAERFCFRGSIDDWIYLGGPDDLETLVKKYMKLIGTDEFFDSPYLL